MRPLQVDYRTFVDREIHPQIEIARQKNDLQVSGVGLLTFQLDDILVYSWHFSSLQYQHPRVLHSVWQDPANPDRIAIVFANWSATAAQWKGTFDPTLYGWSASDSYKVRGVDAVSGMEFCVCDEPTCTQTQTGPITLLWTDTPTSPACGGTDVRLRNQANGNNQKLPPHSVALVFLDK